jgi:hypothetical protein
MPQLAQGNNATNCKRMNRATGNTALDIKDKSSSTTTAAPDNRPPRRLFRVQNAGQFIPQLQTGDAHVGERDVRQDRESILELEIYA